MSYVKYKDGEVTLNFKSLGMYIASFCLIFCVMLADNFYYNYYGLKDNRLTTAAIVCFVFAFVHVLYRFFPVEEAKKPKPSTSSSETVINTPDKILDHNDEASRVEVCIKKFFEKVVLLDDFTDDEDYDSSPKMRRTKRTSPSKKEKKREVIEIGVKTWSKHPVKLPVHHLLDYCLNYLGYKNESHEVEKVRNTHKYVIN